MTDSKESLIDFAYCEKCNCQHTKSNTSCDYLRKAPAVPDTLIEETKKALKFITDIASEELPFAKVGTGAEVALRHINRRAEEALSNITHTLFVQRGEIPVIKPTEDMCTAARGFILGLDIGIRNWGDMRKHLERGGSPTIPYIIEMAEEGAGGHITKWDVADCIFQLMMTAAPKRESGNWQEPFESQDNKRLLKWAYLIIENSCPHILTETVEGRFFEKRVSEIEGGE